MACEKNILDVLAVTPSLAAATDLITITLPDGTSYLRAWANFVQTVPEDKEFTVTVSDGEVNNGDTEIVIAEHIGWRTRLYRNGVPQSKDSGKVTYYAYDISTGTYTLTPAASTGEFFQFQAY